MTTQLQAKFIVLIFLLIFAGCNNSSKKTNQNDVTFDSIVVEKSYHLLENPENPNCNLQINFTYPTKIENKQYLKNIQRIFTEAYFGDAYATYSPQEASAKYAESYLIRQHGISVDIKI